MSSNLSEDDDILLKSRHLSHAANSSFSTFSFLAPSPLSYLFSSYCLSLYGGALWKLSSPALKGLEVTFNKCLRCIWNLPANTHTGILHCCTGFNSIFNTVFARASKFFDRAATSSNFLVHAVFSIHLPLPLRAGFNYLYGSTFMKQYSSADVQCGQVLRDFLLSGYHDVRFGNSSTDLMLRTITTA